MSGQAVSDCVTAICSAYHEACTLIQQIKVEKRDSSLSAQELEASLLRGQSAVRAHYERIQKRLGETSASSDRMSILSFITVQSALRLIHCSGSRRCVEGHIGPSTRRSGSQSQGAFGTRWCGRLFCFAGCCRLESGSSCSGSHAVATTHDYSKSNFQQYAPTIQPYKYSYPCYDCPRRH